MVPISRDRSYLRLPGVIRQQSTARALSAWPQVISSMSRHNDEATNGAGVNAPLVGDLFIRFAAARHRYIEAVARMPGVAITEIGDRL